MRNVVIDVGNDELRIDGFSTHEREIVQFFNDMDEQNRRLMLETSIKLGVTALRAMSTTERVDYVEKNFNQMTNEFKHELSQVFGDKGQLKGVIERYFGEEGRVENYLKTKIGTNGELTTWFQENFGPDGTVIRNLFDPSNDNTPLAAMKKDIVNSIYQVREDLGIKKAEEDVVKRTPLKGLRFQSALFPIIQEIARPFGDSVLDTTSLPGKISHSKKGDFVVEIADTERKIVIEAKEEEYSIKKIQREMREAMENREATYGIFVSKYVEDLPGDVGWFNEYNRQYIVLSLASEEDEALEENLFEIAYKWSRIRTLTLGETKPNEVEIPDINPDLSTIKEQVEMFRNIRTDCTNAEKAIGNIRSRLKNIELEVITALDSIKLQLRSG